MMKRWSWSLRVSISRRRFIATGLAAGSVLAIGACASPPPPNPPITEIRFQAKAPIELPAASISIRDDTAPPPPSPDWSNVFPTLPKTAMHTWGEDRLAAGRTTDGSAVYRITEAAIEHDPGKPVKGVLDPKRRETFIVRVAAVLEIRRADDTVAGTSTGQAWGQDSIQVDEEPYARRKAIDDLVRRVMAEFDREMERVIRANMAKLGS